MNGDTIHPVLQSQGLKSSSAALMSNQLPVLPVLPQKSLSPQPQNRQGDRWDRTASPETDWSMYKYLVCDNGDISNPCGKDGLFNK